VIPPVLSRFAPPAMPISTRRYPKKATTPRPMNAVGTCTTDGPGPIDRRNGLPLMSVTRKRVVSEGPADGLRPQLGKTRRAMVRNRLGLERSQTSCDWPGRPLSCPSTPPDRLSCVSNRLAAAVLWDFHSAGVVFGLGRCPGRRHRHNDATGARGTPWFPDIACSIWHRSGQRGDHSGVVHVASL
jgi:hypothetical protein